MKKKAKKIKKGLLKKPELEKALTQPLGEEVETKVLSEEAVPIEEESIKGMSSEEAGPPSETVEEEEKELYEKPCITRHSVGLMNKFGRTSASVPFSKFESAEIKDMVREYGSPLFIVSEPVLRRKYKDMYRAFSLRYPRVAIAYSYKTNYLSGICSILHSEGAWAEVVSGFEYTIALNLGVSPDKIIFNGPYKKEEELLRAVELGSIINADSLDELSMLEEIAKKLGRILDIGIRVNMELNYPPWDRFGFNFESGQAFDAAKKAVASGHLNIAGIHVHLGTYIIDTQAYTRMAENLSHLCKELQEKLNLKIKYMDVGGGFASRNVLHSQWMPADHICPTFEEYAEAICPELIEGPFEASEMPLLILEPGRAIVDESVHLISTVVSSKRLTNGVKGLVIDAGVNLLPTAYWYRHEIRPVEETDEPLEEVNVYGPLCMQIDIIRMGVTLPSLKKGDLIAIKNVGAYNFSQSMQFIQPRPAVILVNEGKVEILRLPETFDYIKHLERIPERLKTK